MFYKHCNEHAVLENNLYLQLKEQKFEFNWHS